MAELPPYFGPVEALTTEQAAARCGCSGEHFLNVYDGPRFYLGQKEASKLRFPAWALHEWIARRSFTPGAVSGGSAWDKVGNGDQEEPEDVSSRPRNKGAKR